MKVDVPLDAPLGEVADQARRVHRAGFDGGFTFEGPHDVFFPLAEAAPAAGLDLYPNVAIALPRSPMHLAVAAWDLQRASGGRFALALGSQIKPHIERRYSARWDRPVAQMRAMVGAVRAIFTSWQDGTPLDHRSDYHTLTLSVPLLSPGPLECGPPPIWMAAVGPRMTRAAGDVADGIVTHPFCSSSFVAERTRPAVEQGWKAADRSGAGSTFVCGAMVGLHGDHDRDAVVGAVRAQLGFYGSTPAYRTVLEHHGWGHLQPELRSFTKEGRWAELGDMWTDEMVDTLAVVGSPEHVAAELRRRYDGLADRIAVQLPPGTDSTLLDELGRAWTSGGRVIG